MHDGADSVHRRCESAIVPCVHDTASSRIPTCSNEADYWKVRGKGSYQVGSNETVRPRNQNCAHGQAGWVDTARAATRSGEAAARGSTPESVASGTSSARIA